MITFLLIIFLSGLTVTVVHAEDTSVTVSGRIYEFEKNSHYGFEDAVSSGSTSDEDSVGELFVSGNFTSNGKYNGYQKYLVYENEITLTYSFASALQNSDEMEWCIVEDKTRKVNDQEMESDILNGALLLQTSMDGENWNTIKSASYTDIFGENSELEEPFYTTQEIQLQNGCFYRVVVAYKMRRRLEDTSILVVNKKNYEYRKVAEVYGFYAISEGTGASASDTPRKTIGEKINTGKNNGYSGENTIDSDDPHYGWNLGEFFINGYTRETKDDEGNVVFIKNAGDRVTLWFTLQQNITCLNGDSDLSVAEDTDGYDQYFETAKTDFGCGTLIIRYTDEEGVKHDPVLYTNYLAANVSTDADTKVQLFEEGDYEVSLDYEIAEKAGLHSRYTDYKIAFRFSIRNGNCMVFPFDIVTGSELSNQAITENGFSLDMAKSKYLTIDVTRSVLTMGADGQLAEDVRFNRPAKDGDKYTDDGIYTFTVKNSYTGDQTTKTIYVGTDIYLTALSNSGYTVEQLNSQLASGAVVTEDGTIADVDDIESEPINHQESETDSADSEALAENNSQSVKPAGTEEKSEALSSEKESEEERKNAGPAVSIILLIFAILAVIFVGIKLGIFKWQKRQ